MSLINNMVVDSQGGVCLIKRLDYYTYGSYVSGCTCYIVVSGVTEDLYLGKYILPYKNMNQYYYINTGDTSICLNLNGVLINDWVDSYINSLVTTGYVGYSGSTVENRVILDTTIGKYYLINQYDLDVCSGDTTSRWAIVDYNTESVWEGGSTYYYDQLDNCDMETGIRLVKIKDINPISLSYGQVDIISKCKTETTALSTTSGATLITSTSATLNGNITSDGGFNITERGFVYSRNAMPTVNDNKSTVVGGVGVYSKGIVGLTTNSRYYFKSYAKNALGISYGNEVYFNTNS